MISEKSVSIIVPVFNGEKYIRETLISIINQTHSNVECIVINDGSTDKTLDVCSEFSDRIKIFSQPNAGQSEALNFGWRMAKGDYLSYLSADDILKKDAILNLLCSAEKISSEAVIYPLYELIDSDGVKIKDYQIIFDNQKKMFEEFYCPIGPGAIFSRSLFEYFGGWKPGLRQIPDFEYWLRISRRAEFVCCRDICASFRVHDSSQTHAVSDFKKSEESIGVAKDLLEKGIGKNISPKRFLASAYIFSACLHMRSGRVLNGFQRLVEAALHSPVTFFSMYTVKRIAASWTSIFRYKNRS